MDLGSFIKSLKGEKTEYHKNASMKEHTTFKIGGKADVLVLPETKEELLFVLKSAKQNEVPVFVLGKGSNLLVSDEGIEGAVVSLSKLDKVEINGEKIKCGAGQKLSALCVEALNAGLTGLEFAYGIPGSVGGALFMNAGAYGGEMSQVVTGAYCLDEDGNEVYLDASQMNFSYRNSVFKQKELIIVEAELKLNFGKTESIKEKMQELLSRRKEKQPLEYPSAGSTFKRPEGNFAGTLIEKNGLKGCTVGGAMVSKKHAGFIINYDNACAKDVLELIDSVKNTVYSGDKIMLEPEVIFVGRK